MIFDGNIFHFVIVYTCPPNQLKVKFIPLSNYLSRLLLQFKVDIYPSSQLISLHPFLSLPDIAIVGNLEERKIYRLSCVGGPFVSINKEKSVIRTVPLHILKVANPSLIIYLFVDRTSSAGHNAVSSKRSNCYVIHDIISNASSYYHYYYCSILTHDIDKFNNTLHSE